MLRPLHHFSDILADVNSDDAVVRSRAIEELAVLTPLMQQLALTRNTIGVYYTARDFKTIGEACAILEIAYNPIDLWNRPDIDKSPLPTTGVSRKYCKWSRTDLNAVHSLSPVYKIRR